MSQEAYSVGDDASTVIPALEKTKAGFAKNKTRPYSFRIRQLTQLKNTLLSMEKECGEALQKDLGRGPFVSWLTEMNGLYSKIDHTIDNLKNWMKDVSVDTPMLLGPAHSRIVYEPLGNVLVMGSWNFPFYTTLGPLVYVIAAGNSAVIKPSEISAHSSTAMRKVIARSLDSECYKVIEGGVKVAIEATSQRWDGIVFTGSTEKGKLVAQAAAKHLTPCVLELGGKSPFVVDESADLDWTAKKLVFGRYLNAGQICVCPDYVLVHQSKLEALQKLINKYVKEMWDNGKNERDMGRLVSEFHHNRIASMTKDHQGTITIGNANAHEDKKVEPTVILNPAADSAVMKEEIFGPLLPMMTWSNFDEVIKFINNREKPLVAYYFGSAFTNKNKDRLVNETSSGAVVVNDTLFHLFNPDLPFGGVGHSGMGKYHGIEGFKAFSNAKSVLVKPPANHYPYTEIFPPYDQKRQNFVRFLVKITACTQVTMAKRFAAFIVLIWFFRGVAKGSITAGGIKNGAQMFIDVFKFMVTRQARL